MKKLRAAAWPLLALLALATTSSAATLDSAPTMSRLRMLQTNEETPTTTTTNPVPSTEAETLAPPPVESTVPASTLAPATTSPAPTPTRAPGSTGQAPAVPASTMAPASHRPAVSASSVTPASRRPRPTESAPIIDEIASLPEVLTPTTAPPTTPVVEPSRTPEPTTSTPEPTTKTPEPTTKTPEPSVEETKIPEVTGEFPTDKPDTIKPKPTETTILPRPTHKPSTLAPVTLPPITITPLTIKPSSTLAPVPTIKMTSKPSATLAPITLTPVPMASVLTPKPTQKAVEGPREPAPAPDSGNYDSAASPRSPAAAESAPAANIDGDTQSNANNKDGAGPGKLGEVGLSVIIVGVVASVFASVLFVRTRHRASSPKGDDSARRRELDEFFSQNSSTYPMTTHPGAASPKGGFFGPNAMTPASKPGDVAPSNKSNMASVWMARRNTQNNNNASPMSRASSDFEYCGTDSFLGRPDSMALSSYQGDHSARSMDAMASGTCSDFSRDSSMFSNTEEEQQMTALPQPFKPFGMAEPRSQMVHMGLATAESSSQSSLMDSHLYPQSDRASFESYNPLNDSTASFESHNPLNDSTASFNSLNDSKVSFKSVNDSEVSFDSSYNSEESFFTDRSMKLSDISDSDSMASSSMPEDDARSRPLREVQI